MFRFLLRDPAVLAAAGVSALCAALLAVPALSGLLPGHQVVGYWTLSLLGVLFAAVLFPRPRGEGDSERAFWGFVALAVGLWFASNLVRGVLSVWWPEAPASLILNSFGLLLLLAFAYAGECRPWETPTTARPGSPKLYLATAGATAFALGLFGYFVWIPARLESPAAGSWHPAYELFLCLDTFLLLRFLFLIRESGQRRWRWIYSLISMTFALGIVTAGARILDPATRVAELPVETTDPTLYFPLVCLLIAARLRRYPFSQAEGPAVGGAGEGFQRFASRPTIYALALPLLHFAFGVAGWRDPAAEAMSTQLLLVYVVVLGALALLQNGLLQRHSDALADRRQEAEQRLRLLTKGFETMRLGVTVKDLSGKIIYANPAEARMHGYAVEDLIGQPASKLGSEDLRRPMRPEEVRVMNCWRRDSVNQRKDGGTFHVHLISDLVRDAAGEPVALVTTCEDITERKRIEDALRQSESDYRGLFENAHDAILIFRPEDEYVLDANPAACELYGYQREEFIGMSLESVSADPAGGKEHIQGALWRGDFYEFETQQFRRDRSLMHLEVRAAIIQYRDQLAIFSINRDITDRKQSEDALKAANEELKTFLSLVSHDLRAPLVNLKGFASELRQGLGELSLGVLESVPALDEGRRESVTRALNEDIPEALGFIESSVSRMDYLIEALLKLSRAGHRDLEVEPLDMESLVQGVLDSMSYQINRSGVAVRVMPMPEVAADRVSMNEILSNLLTNAVAYRDPDRSASIEIGGYREEQDTIFWVRDNGRGIADDDLDKIFQPFRRSGKQDVPGEGMGLAYVQVLVRRQGGRLWVDSEFSVGSTFYFSITNRLAQEEAQGLTLGAALLRA